MVSDRFESSRYGSEVFIAASSDSMVVATIRIYPRADTIQLHMLHTKIVADLGATFASVSITFV